jgi:hypothetical protein
MSHIFLVIGSEVEGSCVFAAFEAKRDAETFAKLCNEYKPTTPKPHLPDALDTAEDQAAFEIAWKKFKRWQRKHPAGEYGSGYNSYDVQRLRLQPPARTPATK